MATSDGAYTQHLHFQEWDGKNQRKRKRTRYVFMDLNTHVYSIV